MNYEHNRPKDKAGEPHIKEMTRKAIEILQKNKKGFFLFVEGKVVITYENHEMWSTKFEKIKFKLKNSTTFHFFTE